MNTKHNAVSLVKVFGCAAMIACLALSACSRTPHDPVKHVTKVNKKPWSTDSVPAAAVVEVAAPAEAKRKQVVARGGNVAFVVVNETPAVDPLGRPSQSELIYFIAAGHCYRVDGIPFGDKPVTGLAWCNDRYFEFDRWPQQHYGMHFIVDTRTRQIVHATPFPDATTIAQKDD